MIVSRLFGGAGNQMFQYAAGRALADHLGTDLALDRRYMVLWDETRGDCFAHYAKARFRDALREFTRAVQLRPDYAEARMALGIAQLAGGNYQQALQNFQAAARLAPTLVAVHLNLGDAYRATKQWKQALRFCLPRPCSTLGLLELAS